MEDTYSIEEHSDCRNNHFHYYDERKSFCAVSKENQKEKEGKPRPKGKEPKFKEPKCSGGSGAPFVMLEDNMPVLAGITSWGYGCPTGRPAGIYVRVSNFIR